MQKTNLMFTTHSIQLCVIEVYDHKLTWDLTAGKKTCFLTNVSNMSNTHLPRNTVCDLNPIDFRRYFLFALQHLKLTFFNLHSSLSPKFVQTCMYSQVKNESIIPPAIIICNYFGKREF